MVQLTRIYTRGGDKGKTSLGSGKRVSKASLHMAAVGDVDEANSAIGVARLYATDEIDSLLFHIQNDLFDVGADLCLPMTEDTKEALRLSASQIAYLEEQLDFYNKTLPSLTSFVLPGGSPLSATLHQARAVVRRAERSVCALHESEKINEILIQYVNRLSDLLFVLARYDNHLKSGDVLWVPGANR
ncbi:cob(I)yrinic acid a,c-diamide adenosyltransferase [Geitlerinema splendidum]|jgi:cob(I)alamin adenosyltransferase|nr:cob(I)yrinic acid a,c-diamide adenosyltransferase [Geitlerinema splendidum]